MKRYLPLIGFLLGLSACRPVAEPSLLARLHRLHRPATASAGSWDAVRGELPQSLDEYRALPPRGCTAARKYLYVWWMGANDDSAARALVQETAGYLEVFFQLPVRVIPALDTLDVPVSARRAHPQTGEMQVQTGYLLQEVLRPALPDSAAALLALTDWDLYPRSDWSFVFGQALGRVGVWSWARLGDFPRDRLLKTAAHEVGHVFSLAHCRDYACLMGGSLNLSELDGHPMWLCPVCLTKLSENLSWMPRERFLALQDFWARRSRDDWARFYGRSWRALKDFEGSFGQ